MGTVAWKKYRTVNPSVPVPERLAVDVQKAIETDPATNTVDIGSPVFLRITKTSDDSDHGQIEAFLQNDQGRYVPFKSWDICTWSGELGPKYKEGDKQSPEGFYSVKTENLNPNSRFHLSFDLGFPNEFDRSKGRTGSFLMVHGECSSIGCYAMGNPGIEEIYSLVFEALENGQESVSVHAFPFPMTEENLATNADNRHIEFWRNLKQGWDAFEETGTPPKVSVVDGNYSFSP